MSRPTSTFVQAQEPSVTICVQTQDNATYQSVPCMTLAWRRPEEASLAVTIRWVLTRSAVMVEDSALSPVQITFALIRHGNRLVLGAMVACLTIDTKREPWAASLCSVPSA